MNHPIITIEREYGSGGSIVGKGAVLAEGDAAQRDDIIFLEKLPLFPRT